MHEPEVYHLEQGELVPNNRLPALVYRDVLPKPLDAESAREVCEGNNWERRGEWGAIYTPHFHPNTHECYAIFRGKSKLVLGREKDNAAPGGVEVDVQAGDVVVVPAGVSHRSVTAEDDYRYIGVYPIECPKWRNDWCKGEEKMDDLVKEIENVPTPDHDPIFGKDGPLPAIWRKSLT